MPAKKGLSAELFRYSYPIPMRWSDIDEFHHVNNARYLTYFEECRFRYLQETCDWLWEEDGLILAQVSIDYIKPILFTDVPIGYVACTRIGNKSFTLEHLILNKTDNKTLAQGSSVMVGFNYKEETTQSIPEKYKRKLAEYDAKSLAETNRIKS